MESRRSHRISARAKGLFRRCRNRGAKISAWGLSAQSELRSRVTRLWKISEAGRLPQGSGDVIKPLLFCPLDCGVNLLRCRVTCERL
jgi:hypothetical protein